MARLPYPPLPDAFVDSYPEPSTRLNVMRLLTYATDVWSAYLTTSRLLMTSTVLPERLRLLVILRVAYLSDCPYEIALHEPLARASGVTGYQIAALAPLSDPFNGGFSATELAALRLATEVVTDRIVSDETFRAAHRLLHDRGIAELLLIVGQHAGLALFANAVRVDIDDDTGRNRHTTAKISPLR